MGHKVNPKAFRLGPVYKWTSHWFANSKQYKEYLAQDIMLRKNLMKKLKPAGITQVDIERSINKIGITLYVAKPGIAIGRGGSGLDEIKKYIENLIKSEAKNTGKLKLELKVEPVKNINLNAYLVASQIADSLVKRVPYKHVINQVTTKVMASGAKGVRILLSGRIGGAEISRRERFQVGTVPLSTIREKIDFAHVPALTKSGYIGVKVWICQPSEES